MWLSALLSLIPTIVTGVERIHGEAKNGTSKKQMAIDALKLAVSGASDIASEDLQPAITAAGGLVSSVIDGTVSLYNKIGWPSGKTSSQAVVWRNVPVTK